MVPSGTVRQQLTEYLIGKLQTARDLAHLFAIPERQVEEHLAHITRTVGRLPDRRFVMTTPECLDCGFSFRDRKRLTRPSRCPTCRSEHISSPRFGITENS